MSDITVIVPSYNSRVNLISCIYSLKRQEAGDIKFDILIVDSSTDDTPRLALKEFPDLRIAHSQKRLLPGEARNLGVTECASSLLAFIDSDCVADPNWLKNLVKFISVLNCELLCGCVKTLTRYHLIGATSYLMEFNEFMPGRQMDPARFACSANMFCRREIFEKIGGFLGDRLSGEDLIFSKRVQDAGGKIYFSPEAVVWHNDRNRIGTFIQHQLRLGFDSARARKIEKLEGGFFLRFPALVLAIPFLRFFKLLYRLTKFHEYGYLVFAILNSILFLFGYCIWAIGFLKGIMHREAVR